MTVLDALYHVNQATALVALLPKRKRQNSVGAESPEGTN